MKIRSPASIFNRVRRRVLTALFFSVSAVSACADQADYRAQREAMVKEVGQQVRQTRHALGLDHLGTALSDALSSVPRHAFVPSALRPGAYLNRPLPIGAGQTISQPYIVAIMTQLLEVGPGDKVYELGTGSGYQAAILAQMGVRVYTVEIVPDLAERARKTLLQLGYGDVQVRSGDGYLGWPDAAPFDGIIITAAADHIPRPLIEQLRPGGRLVMPVGKPGRVQELIVAVKNPDGTLTRRSLLAVRFVPVTGAHVD